MTTMTTKDVEKLLVKLTDEQKQLLKDAINFGSFGDDECRFYNENNELDYYPCYGFCANDAKQGILAAEKYRQCFAQFTVNSAISTAKANFLVISQMLGVMVLAICST